jgi:hypothetical protein
MMAATGGPETGGKEQLKAVYSREERIAQSGYRGHKPKQKGWAGSRRILLLDLVILFIFGCVIYPLLLKKQETRLVEGYICTVKMRKGKGLSGVEIFITANGDSNPSNGIEITLTDKKGGTFYRWTDVVPEPGETRTYMKAFANGRVKEARIVINGTEEVVSLSRFRIPAFLIK